MENLSRREKERKARRDGIIAAAEKVFCQRGYADASMDEIAREAQFTKRTVYQYFLNKDDLFFAVRLKGRKQLYDHLQSALAQGKSGFERIHLAAEAFHRFYLDFPDVFRLMNEAVHIQAEADAGPNQTELMRFGPGMFRELAKVIVEGKADGSIRPDLDARMAAPVIAFILTGFFRMLADAGDDFTGLLALDQGDFIRFALGLVDEAVRAR